MFEHFTFGPQAQTRYRQSDEVSASPTDISCLPSQPAPTSYPFPEMPGNPAMNDILNKLTNQTLVPDEDSEKDYAILKDTVLCPAFEEAYSEDYPLSYMSTRRGLTIIRSTAASMPSSRANSQTSASCRRLQRQLNTQLQSCTNHVKDITSLVEDMITTNSQCNIYAPPPPSAVPRKLLVPSPTFTSQSPPPHSPFIEADSSPSSPSSTSTSPRTPPQSLDPTEDEGFCELDDTESIELFISQSESQHQDPSSHTSHLQLESETTLRRSSAPSGIRKSSGAIRSGVVLSYKTYLHPSGERIRSSFGGSEKLGSGMGVEREVGGFNNFAPRGVEKGKVRCLPRVRRRRGEESRKEQDRR